MSDGVLRILDSGTGPERHSNSVHALRATRQKVACESLEKKVVPL